LFEAESERWRAWVIGGGGVGFTLLAATMIGLAIHGRVRQERLAAEITEARNTLASSERERANLGDDLHDGAIQSLYAIQLGLTRTAREVADALPTSARVLDETRQRVDVVIAELRGFIRAAARRPEGDAPALEHVLASVVQSLRATTLAELSLDAPPGSGARLTGAQAVALAQLARSALGNALRHAEAEHIAVRLTADEEGVTLSVVDDGKGFAVAERAGAGEGLRSMRQRAAAVGGEFVLETQPGRGTRVAVRLRVAPEPATATTSGPHGGRTT
jgi:signal transduction histidine kinase